MTNDNDLLREFVRSGSESAFADLVSRHLQLVYSAAFRQLGDHDLARDVAQSVFVDLARKARSLRGHTSIVGWLHTSTRFAAARVRRDEFRRKAREQLAAVMNNPSAEELEWERIAPALDAAVGELEAEDQTAVLLRFFQNQELKRVGAALGVSEDAARMRVNRALEKLHRLLTKRGVVLSLGGLGALLTASSSMAVPVGLEEAIRRGVGALAAGGFSLFRFLKPAAAIGGLGIVLTLVLNSGSGTAKKESKTQSVLAAKTEGVVKGLAPVEAPLPMGNGEPIAATEKTGLRFQAVDAESKQPLPQVGLRVTFTLKPEGYRRTEALTDAEGRALIAFPNSSISGASIFANAERYVPMTINWRTEVLPTEYTLQIPRGTSIGGVVVDEAGTTVPNVRVAFYGAGYDSAKAENVDYSRDFAQTDSLGQWGFHRVAPFQHYVNGVFTHPEFAAILTNLPANTAASTNLVFVMKRGATLSGVVRDMNGTAVRGATLREVQNRLGGSDSTAITDSMGHYEILHVREGEFLLMAQAEAAGLAPQAKLINVSNAPVVVDFVLEAGNIFRARVVDESGAPITNAVVQIEWGGQERNRVEWSARVNDQGRVEWNAAPKVPQWYRAEADGFMAGSLGQILADGSEHEFKLKRPSEDSRKINVSGMVTDSATGRWLDDFKVLVSEERSSDAQEFRNGEYVTSGNGGRFTLVKATYRSEFQLQIQKEGYLPFVSQVYNVADGEQRLEVKLRRGDGLMGLVLLSNYETASGAHVFVYEGDGGVYMERGGDFRREESITTAKRARSDEEGRFHFGPILNAKGLIAIHEQGYAEVPLDEFGGHLILKPLGRVEGRLRVGDAPGKDRSVSLGNMQYSFREDGRHFPPLSLHLSAKTDSEGRFVFEKVPPGERLLYVSVPKPGSQMGRGYVTQYKVANVEAGVVTRVDIGGVGRIVTGRVIYKNEVDWRTVPVSMRNRAVADVNPGANKDGFSQANREFWLSEVGREAQRRKMVYEDFCRADGSFEIADILPGTHRLTIEFRSLDPKGLGPPEMPGFDPATASITKDVLIPDGPREERVDLGVLMLEETKR